MEEFAVGNGEFLFFFFLLELAFLFIEFSALELLLLELSVPFFLLSFLEVLGVIDPLVGPLLALLILMDG